MKICHLALSLVNLLPIFALSKYICGRCSPAVSRSTMLAFASLGRSVSGRPSSSSHSHHHHHPKKAIGSPPAKNSNPSMTASLQEAAVKGGDASTTTEIVPFGGSASPVKNPDKDILGGKGLGLQEMASIGISVPPGFTLTTKLCQDYQKTGDLSPAIWDAVKIAINRLERDMGKKFGHPQNPLLLSSRSGAAVSMPGMLDTVLNIGLNEETVQGLAKATNNKRFAYDAYRRLLQMFGDVVMGIPHDEFNKKMDELKHRVGAVSDLDLTAEQLEELCQMYLMVYKEQKREFPQDPYEQIREGIKAVFGSWNTPRAVKYREINHIKGLLGTACNIQAMVFGNLGETSGTGVAFSRDPGTGEKKLKGEYLVNAQGEDVVAGIRTPQDIQAMADALPAAYKEFIENIDKLERHFKDMQDVEFTVQDGKLWLLQCRAGKRTGVAAFKIACDIVDDGICKPEESILLVSPDHVKQVLHPCFSAEALSSSTYKDNIIAVGLPGGPGAAVGKIVFSTARAEELADKGEHVILVRAITSPEDVGGMWAAKGVLTARGGVTSHAAVVARGWGKPCVCGCDDILISEEAGTMTIKDSGMVLREFDIISLNGGTGEVINAAIPMSEPALAGYFERVLAWADSIPDRCTVMANADSGLDAVKAFELGAQGIGLCRTEHMFFDNARLPVVRQWILRGEGLDKVQQFQRSDFKDIFLAMGNKPVTIRLLDPPLHEFLPQTSEVDEASAKELGYDDPLDLIADIEKMHEENPMLGLRGCRLAICRPELAVMQTEAIINAAADVVEDEPGAQPFPRIMVPLVGSVREFENQALIIKRTAERVMKARMVSLKYEIGTMIEVPRAAIVADQIAALKDSEDGKSLCQFFSYGTNDLTQMTLGISRDDAGEFIQKYIDLGIADDDPFKSIDEEGVGWLVRLSAARGRSVNPNLSLSICGEHGGDAKSIAFFDKVGLDYVSCSPFRVPVARLAAGQSSVKRRKANAGNSIGREDRVMASLDRIVDSIKRDA